MDIIEMVLQIGLAFLAGMAVFGVLMMIMTKETLRVEFSSSGGYIVYGDCASMLAQYDKELRLKYCRDMSKELTYLEAVKSVKTRELKVPVKRVPGKEYTLKAEEN